MISSPTRLSRWSSWEKSTRTMLERAETYSAEGTEMADDGRAEMAEDGAEGAEVVNDWRADGAETRLGVLCGPVWPLCGLGDVSLRIPSRTARSPPRLRTSPRWRQACSTASRSALAPANRRSKSGRDRITDPCPMRTNTSSRRWT